MHKLFLKNSSGNILKDASGNAIYFSLPEAYEEVEYIEGGSGQYIITELNFNHTSTLEIYGKSYFTSTGTRGCSASEYANGSQLGLEFISGLRVYNSGNPDFNNSGFTFNTPNEYYVNFNRTAQTITSICNGNVITKTGLYGNNGTNFYLFVDRALRFSTFNKTHRMYYFKMIKDGNMYCYLIPCYRKSDNVIGMYDLVNKVFYTNAGSGTFVKGPRIPEEYQEVEYIESSGTQYINSEVPATSNSGLEIIYSQLASGSAGIFGCRDYSICTFWLSQQSTGNLYAVEFTGQSRKTMSQAYNTGYHHIIIKNNSLFDNDVLYGSYINNSNGSLNIWLFRTNESGSPYSGSCSGRLQLCKIYNKNTLIRDFIPCYRKSDNVIGLYDRINDKFYINSGTGTFTKGEDVN